MPSVLANHGAQPQKPTRFADLYTGRFFSGLFTNRSPLRDGTTDHLTERFYGQVGDTMIAGNNVEISNRLTLIRRPGNDVFDSNSYTAINRMEEFRLFSPTTTHIKTMVDESTALSALDGSTKTSIFTKAANAGQSHMQAVENSLYWGDGVSNKKWLQTLNTWATLKTASTSGVGGASLLGTSNYPFMSTFIVDSNNNIEQLIAYGIQTVSNVAVAGNVATFTVPAVTGISVGQTIAVWLNTNWTLNGLPLKVLTASGTTVTASPTGFGSGATMPTIGSGADTGAIVQFQGVPTGSNLLLGAAQPTWSTTVPASTRNFSGGITTDGNAVWMNRGNYVQNWGISPPSVPITVMKFGTDITNGASTTAWRPNTYYSPDGVIIDANGGIQLLTTAGKSGSSTPAWPAAGAGVGSTTTDGTNVWTKIQTAASTTWAASHQYTGAGTPNFTPNTNSSANYIVANGCLFKLVQGEGPWFTNGTNVQCQFYHNNSVTLLGRWQGVNGSMPAPDSGPTNITSLLFGPTGTVSANSGNPLPVNTINGAGETTGTTTPDAGAVNYFGMSVFGSIHVPATALTLTIAVSHDDGMQFGFGTGTNLGGTPVLIKSVSNIGVSSTFGALAKTGVKGYNVIGANNQIGNAFEYYVIQFPAEDDYPFEFNLAQNTGQKQLAVNIGATCNIVPTPLQSGQVTPIWPAWSSLGLNAKSPVYGRKTVYDANLNSNTNAFSTYSSQAYKWVNMGPTSDFSWIANINYNPAGAITDANGNSQFPVRAGQSAGKQPSWATGQGQYTTDNNIKWLNQGLAATSSSNGLVSTFNGGWEYAVSLANSLDETVSNATPMSTATGNFVNSAGVQLAAAAGLPTASLIDTQCDQVCIFRSTDGQTIPLLIDGVENSFFTIPLCTYLQYGFTDSTPDTDLDANLTGPIAGECTSPAAGARCLAMHLNRLFFSVGNTVYWTAGPDAPIGNGTDGVIAATNFSTVSSLVTRLVPTATGVWVFTVSDIWFIPGTGQVGDPIRQAQRVEEGVGLLSYNALAVNGSVIGFFTSDKQFVLMQPGAGIIYVGHPIGDQFRSPNAVYGTPSALSWNPANVYVAWHVNGEDQAWYVCDGTYGWYRMMATPSPERSLPCWSPFATIVGGVKAINSVETAPGTHNLLLGPTGTGSILKRNLATNQDNSTNYAAFAVVGSIVLAHPGEIAEVMFITTDSANVGTPLTLAILIGEAIPQYTGPFESLPDWVSDPPNQPQSNSVLGQRFYMDESQEQSAMMRHLQLRFIWPAQNAASECYAYSIWGTYSKEQ